MKTALFKKDKAYILYDSDCIENPAELGFESGYWTERDAVTGYAEGRGSTLFFRFEDSDFVLRHYRRGGFIARLSEDHYIWCGLERSRAWREWRLLAWMYEQDLPVPRPLAARVIKHGLIYTADIITRRVNDTETLAEHLRLQALPEDDWKGLGRVIRRFHLQRVWHADLNANNILLDAQRKFYLIDFDRGRVRNSENGWRQANLSRLKRSLDKIKLHSTDFHFSARAWQALLAGYYHQP